MRVFLDTALQTLLNSRVLPKASGMEQRRYVQVLYFKHKYTKFEYDNKVMPTAYVIFGDTMLLVIEKFIYVIQFTKMQECHMTCVYQQDTIRIDPGVTEYCIIQQFYKKMKT